MLLIISVYVSFFILSPPFQMPDEPDHYQYIFLLSRRHYPRLTPSAKTPGDQKLLQIMEEVFSITKVASRDFSLPDFHVISSFVSEGDRSTVLPSSPPFLSKQGHQPPLYHIVGSIVFGAADRMGTDLMTQFYAVRSVSAVFYFLTVFLLFRLFLFLLKTKEGAENLTVFAAINPLVLKMGISINPDIALLFFSVLFLFTVVRSYRDGKEYHPLIYAALAGLAILTKFQGVFLVPLYPLFLLLKRVQSRKLLRSSLLYCGGCAAIVLPLFLANMRRYGAPVVDNFAIMCKQDLPQYPVIGAVWQAVFEFRHTLMHFAGFWGWGEPYPFKPFFLAYAVIFGLSIAIGAGIAARKNKPVFSFLVGSAFSLVFFLVLVGLRHKLLRYSCDIQGRYILPVFPVLSFFSLISLMRILRLKEQTVSRMLMFFSIFQAYFILWYVVIPKYYV